MLQSSSEYEKKKNFLEYEIKLLKNWNLGLESSKIPFLMDNYGLYFQTICPTYLTHVYFGFSSCWADLLVTMQIFCNFGSILSVFAKYLKAGRLFKGFLNLMTLVPESESEMLQIG